MSLYDPEELADIRGAFTETLTDTAYILRKADQAAVTAAGKPVGALSNGAGGIRQTIAPPAPNAPEAQYDQLPGPIPCRLSVAPRGIGEFLLSSVGATQAKTSYRLDLPYNTRVLETDRIKITTDTDSFTAEVIAIEPNTDQFTRAVKLTRIN